MSLFRRTYALSVDFKMKFLKKKTFSSVKTKTNPNSAVELAERSNHAKKVRRSLAAILALD